VVERASVLARSPRLIARWQVRRSEALAAVEAVLAGGTLLAGVPAAPDELARLLHKVAGTAAMFGEPEFGTAASALERALVTGASSATCTALAHAMLAEGRNEAAAGPASAAGRG